MPAGDPDKELKACLDRLPFPRWARAQKLINDGAKPTYLNFNALGAKLKTYCMTGEAKHALKMSNIFRSFNNDPVPFLDWEQLCTSMRKLVALDKVEVLKELIALFKANGQNPRSLPPGARWSLLTWAAFLGKSEILDYLTGKEGCFPTKFIDEADEQGYTALVWASASGSVESVKILLDRSADVNVLASTKESPLMIAACKGHARVVRHLIDRDADVNVVDGNGWGPIQKACWWGHDDVLGELLLEHAHSPKLEKTLRAAAMLQGHDTVIELLDGKRGPRSFPRVSLKLFLGVEKGTERDLRREVRTAVANALKVHRVMFSDVAVPEFQDAEEGVKGKIAMCEIRIMSSSVVGVRRDLLVSLQEAASPIRKAGKLQVDPAQSVCTITWPMSKMTKCVTGRIAEAIQKGDELHPPPRGKKNPLELLDIKNAPTQIVTTVVESVQESLHLYESVTKHLEDSEPQALTKLRDVVSKGRFFIEAPYVKENDEDEEKEEEEDPEDNIYFNEDEKEDDIRQMLSTLVPFEEAKNKGLVEDVCEHFQTTDVQKRYEAQFKLLKEKRKKAKVLKDVDAPAAELLAPTFKPPEKKKVEKVEEEEKGKDIKAMQNTLPSVRKSAMLAQKKLKALIAPKTEWANAVLNDPNSVPHGDEKRSIHDQGLVAGGHCTDPGIKGAARIEEKAKARNREEPNYMQIIDICRLGINFTTVDSLLACLQALVAKADVCWLDNKFRTPSALGYQDINMGIRVTLPGEKSHICEVQLSLDVMFEAKMSFGHELYEKMRSSLADLHIPAHLQDPLLRTIIGLLDEAEGN